MQPTCAAPAFLWGQPACHAAAGLSQLLALVVPLSPPNRQVLDAATKGCRINIPITVDGKLRNR